MTRLLKQIKGDAKMEMDVLKELTKIDNLLNTLDVGISIENVVDYNSKGEVISYDNSGFDNPKIVDELMEVAYELHDGAMDEIENGRYLDGIEYLKCLDAVCKLRDYLLD